VQAASARGEGEVFGVLDSDQSDDGHDDDDDDDDDGGGGGVGRDTDRSRCTTS